jgi:hypothetical protein
VSLGEKIAALLTGLTASQIAAMSPVGRQQLVEQCRHITELAALAEARPEGTNPKSGVLSELHARRRDE